MEDRENCTTELFLKEDGQVLIGETDGPLWREATGVWMIDVGTDDFTMRITRHYQGGHEGSDMGEFKYSIERTFVGDMTAVGESVAITGLMRALDVLTGKELEVGFFNMIDGTDVRLDKRDDAMSGVVTDDGTSIGVPTKKDTGKDVTSDHRGWDSESQMTYYQKEQEQQWQQQQQDTYNAYTYQQQQQQLQQQQQAAAAAAADPYAAYYAQQAQAQQQAQKQQQQELYGQQDPAYDDYREQQQQQQQQQPPPQQQNQQAYTYEEYYRQQQQQDNVGPDGWPRY
jgi:hypothetical protein